MSDERRIYEPHDRLTRLCAAMTDTLDAHPETSDEVRCIVFLNDGERAGVELHGYEDDMDAMADLLIYLRGVFAANGKDLQVHALGGEG